MDIKLNSTDDNISETSKKLLSALEKRSSLAWPIFKKQCEIAQLNPARLEIRHLPDIVPRITEALSRFTSTENGESFATEILGRPVSLPVTPRGTIRPGLFKIEPVAPVLEKNHKR